MTQSAVNIVVRQAERRDAEGLADLVRGLAAFEGKADVSHITVEAVTAWTFGPEPACEILLAERDGRAIGYLAFYRAFSLFKGGPVLLVENVYVAEAERRQGVGRRLIATAAREAERRGFPRIELHVRDENRDTMAFYEGLGFHAPGEAVYRIEDDALRTLADR